MFDSAEMTLFCMADPRGLLCGAFRRILGWARLMDPSFLAPILQVDVDAGHADAYSLHV